MKRKHRDMVDTSLFSTKDSEGPKLGGVSTTTKKNKAAQIKEGVKLSPEQS